MRQRERIVPKINFREGINAVPGFFGGDIRDILNLDLNDYGWLVPRKSTEEITISINQALVRDFRTDSGYVTLGTRPDETIHYIAGSQLVFVHFEGDEQDDPVTRAYYLDEGDSWVVVQQGRILFIAGDNGSYFIDVKENRRHNWGFGNPVATDAVTVTGLSTLIDDFNRLNSELLINFANTQDNNVWNGYPGLNDDGQLQFISESLKPYAFKVSYIGQSIGFFGPASKAVVGLLAPDISSNPVFQWITENRQNLRNNILVTGFDDEDNNLISRIQSQGGTAIYVDKTQIPDWQGVGFEIEVFAAEVPEDLYELEDGEVKITDEIAIQVLPDSEYVRVGKATSNTENPQFISISLTGDEVVYLDAQFNQPPPQGLYGITEHAGRIYGVDGKNGDIVFTHINGDGISNRFVFPIHNRISTDASGPTPIVKLEQMPNRGGLYAFKRNSIHYIEGQNIFSGLYNISVGTNTDISAADYKKNVGCISAKSIKNDGEQVLFVGNNQQVYSLSGKTARPIGATIKPFIRSLARAQQRQIATEWYNEKFYITLPDSVLVLDTERKYWTRFDWQLTDVFYEEHDDVFYGLQGVNTLLRLDVETDEVFPTLWEANVQIRNTGSLLTAIYVYTDDGEEITIGVKGNEPPYEITRSFIPKLSNKYRAGVHCKGRHLDIKIESETPVTIDRIDFEETV